MKSLLPAVLFVVSLGLMAGPALASDGALEVGDGSRFAAQRASIEASLAEGPTYAEITGASRREVRAALARIDELLGGAGMAALDAGGQDEVREAEARVNELLAEAAVDSRLVCTRERTLGSNRTQRVCLTSAERRRQAAHGQREVEAMGGN